MGINRVPLVSFTERETMPNTKKRVTRKMKRQLQAAALRALHERGHYTADERAKLLEVEHCVCGALTFRGNLLCGACAADQACKD